MPAIRLNDGKLIQGDGWEDVERELNATGMNAAIEPAQFRDELARRALVWTGTEIYTDGSAKDFLAECERAGLLTVFLGEPSPDAKDEKPRQPDAQVVYIAERARAQARSAARKAAYAAARAQGLTTREAARVAYHAAQEG